MLAHWTLLLGLIPYLYAFQSNFNPFRSLSSALGAHEVDFADIVSTAARRGFAGAEAASVQVITLCWLRTIVNYEYKTGLSTQEAFRELWVEGGLPRLYSGLPFALVQVPLSRFGDTAANALVLSIIANSEVAGTLPVSLSTALASLAAGLFRIGLMPIDTLKTCFQVNGDGAFETLKRSINKDGLAVLYKGGAAASVATTFGHWPWFAVYNSMQEAIPIADVLCASPPLASTDPHLVELFRSAFIGLCASCTSDVCSNSIRVLKTTRQASIGDDGERSYLKIARDIINIDGYAGLFGRGLRTRLATNAIQGGLFSVLFKLFQQ